MRTVQQILEDAGYEPRAYSGRGMGGKECLAVEFDDAVTIGKLFADTLESVYSPACPDWQEEECIAKAFRHMRQDSLGMGTVVYFPRIAFEP